MLGERPILSFYCKVSKGTYVRTLAKEIGEKLGYPAHLPPWKGLRAAPSGLKKRIRSKTWNQEIIA